MTEYIDGHRWPQRAVTPDAPSRPETPPTPAPDQQDGTGASLPNALRDFLRLPDVIVRPDEERCAVVIAMPSYLARSLAAFAPDPLQVRLAAQLVEAAEMDAADARLELLRGAS